jgi:hypothetical protein
MAPALSLERFVRGKQHDASVARERQRLEVRRQAKLTKQYHTALRREGFEVDEAARTPRAPAPTLLARRKGRDPRPASVGEGEGEAKPTVGGGDGAAPAGAAAAAPARGGFAHAQALANQRRLDAERARLEAEQREKDKRRKLRERKQRTLKLQQRTRKGQPLMNRRVDLLLEKIQKTV